MSVLESGVKTLSLARIDCNRPACHITSKDRDNDTRFMTAMATSALVVAVVAAVVVLLAAGGSAVHATESSKLTWVDVRTLSVRGRAFNDTAAFWNRLVTTALHSSGAA